MENKINVAELLKDCPKGMELYSPIFGKVYLDKIRLYLAIVVTTDKEQGDVKEEFLYDGRYGMNGECMLFPSKNKTTWEGFVPPCQFKDGDVIITGKGRENECVAIFESDRVYEGINGFNYHSLIYLHTTKKVFKKDDWAAYINVRLATEEEKQKLFDVIKDNGYCWNAETKKLEKLTRFKVGDQIVKRNSISNSWIVASASSEYYGLKLPNGSDSIGVLPVSEQDDWELVPNKFDITTLKPFDKVLVREDDEKLWRIHFFERLNYILKDTFVCMGGYRYHQCVPYEGNEHLLNTNNEPDDFYKTWKRKLM